MVSSAGETSTVSPERRGKTKTNATNPHRTAPMEPIRSARETSSLARGRAFVRAIPTASREVEDVGADRAGREPWSAAGGAVLRQQEPADDQRQRQGEADESLHDVPEADAAPLRGRR